MFTSNKKQENIEQLGSTHFFSTNFVYFNKASISKLSRIDNTVEWKMYA